MQQLIFTVACRKCQFFNSLDAIEVDCRKNYFCANCGEKLATTKVLGEAVDELEARIKTSGNTLPGSKA